MTTRARASGADRMRVGQHSRGDNSMAYRLLGLLWASVLFIFFAVLPFANAGLVWAMAIGGGALLAYNTHSILAMSRQTPDFHSNALELAATSSDQLSDEFGAKPTPR